jgi:segregation and condensation protein B
VTVREGDLRIAEAALFASAEPVGARALGHLLADDADADAVLAALRERYAGRGVEVVEVAGGWQLRTAPDLAAMLRRVVVQPGRLPRAAMEALAVVAYHQPVTRAEIELVRGASLGQTALDALLEAGLIAPCGRKETPGRPTLWGTTPAFLTRFGLRDLRDLPRREDLVVDAPVPLPVEIDLSR